MKSRSLPQIAIACAMSAWIVTALAGCQPKGTSGTQQATQQTSTDHGHDHGHDHAETGPHGGHLVELGDEQLHAEWTHDDARGEVVVYILDAAAESDVALTADSISIATKIGETEKTYQLLAVGREAGAASRFALTDPALVEALKAVGPGIEATITVTREDGPLSGQFERHEHAGHQH